MLSIIQYAGSKRLDYKYFVKYIPKHITTIVEPFGGSAYVSLALFKENPEIKCHVNDNDEKLINFYNELKKNAQKVIDGYNTLLSKLSKESFDEVIKNYKNDSGTKLEKAINYLYYRRVQTFFKLGTYPINKKIQSIDMSKFPVFFEWIKKTKFTCHDYEVIFDEYKNVKSAFMFIDPPYLDSFNARYNSYIGKTITEDKLMIDNTKVFVDIIDLFDARKCKCMLIINKNAITMKLYDGYVVDEYDKLYQVTKKKTKHLVICNY